MLKIYNNAKVASRLSAFVITIVAALVPVLTMVALYFIRRTINRLWSLAGFTVFFSLALKLFTTAKSSEVFAVVAA